MSIARDQAPKLQKYELLEQLGHGGMATVFRARDRRLGREVAVKLIHRHLRESEEVAARFVSEARAVAKLRHRNIVEVYDISDQEEEERYLVVELVRGPTLRELLKRHGRMPPEIAAAAVLELTAALEHAHAEGVVHRDVKPENVLVELPGGFDNGDTVVSAGAVASAALDSADEVSERSGAEQVGKIKLTDFGIAKLLDAQGVTSTGQVLGSPAHMAPEQIEGGRVGVRADVFGLGVLFYECLVGSLPFAGKNPAQVLRSVLEGRYTPPHQLVPTVGEAYSDIVSVALARHASDRYASVGELARALTGELSRVGIEDPERELQAYLADPVRYAESYPDRIVPELIRAGRAARADKDVSRAARYFNRALAYRPGDSSVLVHVTGLRRRARVRKVLAVALGVVVVASLGVVVTSALQTPELGSVEPGAVVPDDPKRARLPAAMPPEPSPAPRVTEKAPEPQIEPAAAASRQPIRRPNVKPPVNHVGEAQTRSVTVRVTGAMGGTVRIDGVPREWFGGVTHELSLGPHNFEFVPPNDTCCVGSSREVVIKEGEGTQVVVGSISFKNAVVRVAASQAGELACPTLFSGVQPVPGERAVNMNRAQVSGSCTIVPVGPEGSAPQRKVVTLRAGQTTVLRWP